VPQEDPTKAEARLKREAEMGAYVQIGGAPWRGRSVEPSTPKPVEPVEPIEPQAE
jgi:hypothetical protein